MRALLCGDRYELQLRKEEIDEVLQHDLEAVLGCEHCDGNCESCPHKNVCLHYGSTHEPGVMEIMERASDCLSVIIDNLSYLELRVFGWWDTDYDGYKVIIKKT